MAKSLNSKPKIRAAVRVAVLMSVKDGIEWLPAAVDSILTQTFPNFRFIIIDDGSIDETPKYLKSLRDKRICLVHNQKSLGLTKSLNKGLQMVREEYIARMDADDIAIPERLEIQVNFMDRHPEVGISGSARYIIGDHTKAIYNTISDSQEIAARLLFENPLAHPTTIIRTNFLKKFQIRYNENLAFAQDYDLWSRAAEHTIIRNIPQPLLYYRHHQKQIAATRLAEQTAIANAIRNRNLARIGIQPTQRQQECHEMLSQTRVAMTPADVFACLDWIRFISERNQKLRVFNPSVLYRILSQKARLMTRAYYQYPTKKQKLMKYLQLLIFSIKSGRLLQLLATIKGSNGFRKDSRSGCRSRDFFRKPLAKRP